MTTLADRTVLVTGANRGIGLEFVTQLLERGVTRVYAGARDPSAIPRTDPRVEPLELDVTDPATIARAAAIAADADVVVNNAGVLVGAPIMSPDLTGLRRELEVNLFGPIAVANAFVDGVAARSGAIVNMASVMSWLGGIGGSYGVTKAAIWSATDAMRVELAPRGVQVVGVYMGYVDTDMTTSVEAPKSSPAEIVRQVLDGVEAGVDEVLADETARRVRASLSLPFAERYQGLIAARA